MDGFQQLWAPRGHRPHGTMKRAHYPEVMGHLHKNSGQHSVQYAGCDAQQEWKIEGPTSKKQ